jgi:hypothetical protein
MASEGRMFIYRCFVVSMGGAYILMEKECVVGGMLVTAKSSPTSVVTLGFSTSTLLEYFGHKCGFCCGMVWFVLWALPPPQAISPLPQLDGDH